jgi:hypothetical protein
VLGFLEVLAPSQLPRRLFSSSMAMSFHNTVYANLFLLVACLSAMAHAQDGTLTAAEKSQKLQKMAWVRALAVRFKP